MGHAATVWIAIFMFVPARAKTGSFQDAQIFVGI